MEEDNHDGRPPGFGKWVFKRYVTGLVPLAGKLNRSLQVLKTPFYSYHQKHEAQLVDFAGWEMPIRYGSIIEEHKQVRNSGGLFDVSHMGRVKFTGPHARRLLERLLTRRISNMKDNTCRYSLVCNEQGGVLDDVLIYRMENHWLLVVNASNRAKLLKHFAQVQGDMKVKMEDQTQATAMIAVQGPNVMELLSGVSSEVPGLKRYTFCVKNLLMMNMIISRTGYTGEDGVEIILNANMAVMALKLLTGSAQAMEVVKPVGLGARDTLRLEAGMPLYGHELDEETDPFAAGLDFAVSLDKDEHDNGERFIGQDALKKIKADGPGKKLIGLKLEGKRTARQGMTVYALAGDDGQDIGEVTSGCLSPTLGASIAMAYVQPGFSEIGRELALRLGAKLVTATVVDLPFYKRPVG
jgi:aminomethyltransferase